MDARRAWGAAVAGSLSVVLVGCGESSTPTSDGSAKPADQVTSSLRGPSGATNGAVTVSFGTGVTTVTIRGTHLPPGLHGLHVHKVGRCEAPSPDPADPATTGPFLSAGGHLAAPNQSHGNHNGDLPGLLVAADGTARLVVASDHLARRDLLDADGSALVVHAMRDNLANIPSRYAPGGADEMTKKSGDSGGRIACAVIEAK
jgi:superoxide dismutase, Cu-Zn family